MKQKKPIKWAATVIAKEEEETDLDWPVISKRSKLGIRTLMMIKKEEEEMW